MREQRTAEGHSVRAVYLYSGMADIAAETDDEPLFDACSALFENITEKRMFVTGGIGSSASGEMFTADYDLPNKHAYAESCAALGLALFARRMNLLESDAKYADTVERIIYNGFLSSISLDGKSFFYENPLEIDLDLHRRNEKLGMGHFPPAHRFEVFVCFAVSPNIYIFFFFDRRFYLQPATENSCQSVYVILLFIEVDFYISGDAETNYPYDGRISFPITKTTLLGLRSFLESQFRSLVLKSRYSLKRIRLYRKLRITTLCFIVAILYYLLFILEDCRFQFLLLFLCLRFTINCPMRNLTFYLGISTTLFPVYHPYFISFIACTEIYKEIPDNRNAYPYSCEQELYLLTKVLY